VEKKGFASRLWKKMKLEFLNVFMMLLTSVQVVMV